MKNTLIISIILKVLFFWAGLIILMNFGFMAYTGSLLFLIPVLAGYLGIFYISYNLKISSSSFLTILFLTAFFSKLYIALIVDTPPVSDFKTLNDAAMELSRGDYSFNEKVYFQRWAYQTGYVVYASYILRLTGGSILALKVLNCIFMASMTSLIYLSAKKIGYEKGARFSAAAYLIYPANFFLTPVLTNQHLALLLLYLSLFVILKYSYKVFGLLTAGFLAALSQAIRPDGVILIFAVICGTALLIRDCVNSKSDTLFKIKRTCIFLFTYLIIGFILSTAIKTTGINPQGLANADPLWKFVVGLNHNHYGVFSEEDSKRIMTIDDNRERTQKELEVIKHRVFGEAYRLPVTLLVKQGLLWADFEDMYWGFHHLDGEISIIGGLKVKAYNLLDVLKKLDKAFYFITQFLFCQVIWRGIHSNRFLVRLKKNQAFITLIMMLFISVGIFTIIEVQVRYRYLVMPVLFIVNALSDNFIAVKLKAFKLWRLSKRSP